MAENMITGMASPEEPMAPEATAKSSTEGLTSTAEETPTKFDMETLMGNFMDLPQEERKIATRILATPAPMIFDKILGEPVMQRLATQLDQPIEVGSEEPTPEGMMAPSAIEPMTSAPTEDEEATPPV